MEDYELFDKIEKLKKHSNSLRYRIVYEWVKTDYISFKEFKVIMERCFVTTTVDESE
jgi:hypothetical protein